MSSAKQEPIFTPSSPTGSLSSPVWVTAIISNEDPVVRNFQITQSYHQFILDFLEKVNAHNLCWCGFATWASRQAGQFIRGEQVPPAILELLGLHESGEPMERPWYWFLIPEWLLRSRRFLAYARLTVEDISAYIAMGNRRVYTKLAPIFADFLAMVRDLPAPDPEKLQAFQDQLAQDPTNLEGIHIAFTNYYLAIFEPDPKIKAERIFLANLLIGEHEQIRLQEAIDGALKAPIQRALDDPDRRWTSWPIPLWLRRMGVMIIKWAFKKAILRLEAKWLQVATRLLMTLSAPAGILKLGEDVPPLPDGSSYPENLSELQLPELLIVLEKLDYTPNTLFGSGAKDWTNIGDRLNYIADLFRSRQQDLTLAEPPFTAEQVAAIVAGKIPEGEGIWLKVVNWNIPIR